MSQPPPQGQPPPVFATTQWTRVLEARGQSPEAKAALGDLCVAYYAPVCAFIRSCVPDEHRSRDLTQEFFARLLKGGTIDSVDPARGRFRSFLLGAVKHFLADMHHREARLKRGGGQPVESLQARADHETSEMEIADLATSTPEREFDREWALTLLNLVLRKLAEEHRAEGNEEHFHLLKAWLTGDTEETSQAESARNLGMSEGAVKVAIHRLRRRFRELVKAEIASTLQDPSQAESELASLMEALRG